MATKKEAAAPAAKKRKKQPAYKRVLHTITVESALADGYAEIQALAEEMREGYDNMEGNGLGATSKCQAYEEAADALECAQEVEAPDKYAELEVKYAEMVPARKGRYAGRAVRLSNALAMIGAAREAVEAADTSENDDEAANLINDIDSLVGDVEGVEFPGMFG